MIFGLLLAWLAVSAFLLGRGMAYLAALLGGADWHWMQDRRIALLLVPLLVPLALVFYSVEPAAMVLVVLAFAMFVGWCCDHVFRALFTERHTDTAGHARRARWIGALCAVLTVLVVLSFMW